MPKFNYKELMYVMFVANVNSKLKRAFGIISIRSQNYEKRKKCEVTDDI